MSERETGGRPLTELVVLVDVAPAFEGEVEVALVQQAVEAALQAAMTDASPPNDDALAEPPVSFEVSVRVTDSAEMQQLNRDYRRVDKPTDVLSFSFLEGPSGGYPPGVPLPPGIVRPLGEVAISYPEARQQADELGHPVPMELAWLTIHGTLQLLGYGHYAEAEAAHMESLEREALEALSFPVPPA